MDDYWFRFEDYRTASSDPDSFESNPNLRLLKLRVEKVTRKGVRLSGGKFVLRDARKRYACPTKEEAQISFLARKSRQREILQYRLRHIEDVERLLAKGKFDIIEFWERKVI